MTGISQTLSDLKLIVATDRRVWASGVFVFFVILVWLATGAWRGEEMPIPQDYVNVRVEEDKINSLVSEFNQDIKESSEERKFLRDYIVRVSNEVSTGKDEIDWHVNVLVNKLDDITERVDVLANKIGASAIQTTQLEEMLKKQKSKGKRKQKVDWDTR